jgi:hypothetical protein
MIAAYFLLGGVALSAGSGPAVGTVSIAYASTGLAGYLGFRLPPTFRAMSVNAVSGLGALLGISAIATSGVNMTLLMLTALHIIDLICGADESRDENLDKRNQEESVGPLTNFFTTSWKSNGFNKRNFMTCQTVQVILLCLELFFSLILTVDGGMPKPIEGLLLLTVFASIYSFFSP